MSNSAKRQSYREFLKEAASRYQNAGEVIKQAADEEALNGIKDPDSKGTTSIPGFGDGSNRSAQSLPENRSNMGEPNKDRNIINVTDPNGTGQGEYIQPRDGDALDNAATSPTTPLEKMSSIAAQLKASAEAMKSAFSKSAAQAEQAPVQAEQAPVQTEQAPAAEQAPAQTEQAPAQEAAPQEKQASPGFGNTDMPTSLDNPDIMSKLAATAYVALGTEDGARALTEALEKQAGAEEARAIIYQLSQDLEKEAAAAAAYNEELAKQASVQSLIARQQAEQVYAAQQYEMQKQAAAAQQASAKPQGIPYVEFQKAAMADMAHNEWCKFFNDSPLQKQAYAQGAADGDAAAAAMAEGGEPDIPGAGDVTADDVVAYLQQLVESGQIQQEEAEAVLQTLGAAADDGVDPQEFADALRQAVESGQVSPEEAEVIAQQYMAQFGGGEGAPAGAPDGGAEVPPGAEEEAAAAAAQDPVAAGAAAEGVQKAASIVKGLWGNNN